MRPFEMEHPAPATERAIRMSELEDMARCLVELGWIVEKVTLSDEAGEPLRGYLRMAVARPSELGGVL